MISYLYIPELRCNLKCRYCYVKDQYDLNIITKSNISEDLDEIERSIKEQNIENSPILHGGEILLLSIDELDEVISRLGELATKKKIGIQSNLTLLTDEHIDLLDKHRQYLQEESPISTSLEFPRELHNKYRCDSYDIVMENMIKLRDRGFNVSVIHTFHKEIVEQLDKFHTEFMEFRKEFPNSISKFNLIHCSNQSSFDKYVLNDEEQIKLADYISENNFWKEAMVDKREGKEDTSDCHEVEFCMIPTFRVGRWGFCHRLTIPDKTPKDTVILPIKKTLHEDCESCEFIDRCHSGCVAEKTGTGKNKKWTFCAYRKRLLTNYKEKE